MSTRLAATVCLGAMLVACRDPYYADVEPGPNGEPGAALSRAYSKEFRVAKRDYFAALTEFYTFASQQGFEQIDFGDCFGEVLDFVRDDTFKPCIGMFGAKGAPTKAHMTFTVIARSFNGLDHNDHLTYQIGIYIHSTHRPAGTLARSFAADVEGRLAGLDRKVEAGQK